MVSEKALEEEYRRLMTLTADYRTAVQKEVL